MTKKRNFQNNTELDLGEFALTFDLQADDNSVQSQGISMVHYKVMQCPIGQVSPDDSRAPHEHHQNCSNGWILNKAGECTVMFQGNTHSTQMVDVGKMETAVAQATFTRFYDDKPDTYIAVMPFDRLYYADEATLVETSEKLLLGPTGTDPLRFEGVKGLYLWDSNGKSYTYGTHYTVSNGNLSWIEPHWPGSGTVVSIRYLYRPYWIVSHLVHEIRVAQQIVDGERVAARRAQCAVLQREFFFRDTQNDPNSPRSIRQEQGPDEPEFGPR